MSRSEFFAHLSDLLEAEGLSGPELLTEHGWDSMTAIGFIAMVDEHLHLAVKPATLVGARTAGDLAALVDEHLTA